MKNNKKGFTLVELLVVIAIIGLLSTLAVVALNNARQKSRDAKRISDVKQMQTALELFFNDQNRYPGVPTPNILGDSGALCLGANGFAASGCTAPVYMAKVPSNPEPIDGGIGYTYNLNTDASEYSIEYYLANQTGGVDAGLNTACSSGISGCTVP